MYDIVGPICESSDVFIKFKCHVASAYSGIINISWYVIL